MAEITLRNGHVIGDYLKPYIVAELNTSHFGNIDIAKDMISKAKEVGCDCVKFQSWSADSLYCASYYKENSIAKRIFNKFSMDSAQLKELSIFSKQVGIDFSSTPYSIDEAKFLVNECGVPFVKIASMELNNLPYLKQLGELGAPLVLSTGMGTSEEIVEAVNVITSTGNKSLTILHCTSVYPSKPKDIRLQNIVGLRKEFPSFPIGYSDHSESIDIPVASIALGACIVERHFTIDSSRIGMDNQMATEPDDMRMIISACHRVYEAMGSENRILSSQEKDQIKNMRRSVVTKTDLKRGDIITENNIEFKRPGTGIPPSDHQLTLGKKVNKVIEAGTVLNIDDLI